ncbi:Uncharacterised protein [Serratia ficaria]|uniref:ead/Ea22-like family protein n=1 Tax=Serratia ficaria TaxID=61651 RepID=UPI0021C4F2E6|nr:ead/Ea22-like family protein [Serratia ficaria]CAI2786450.1 Uncharacterised protein [Serratia ficaria]
MDKFSELKAVALAATPGPWSWKVDGIFYYLSPEGINTPLERIIDDGSAWGEYGETIEHDSPDARFIAAANPAVVLALLAELEAKDKHIADMERVVAAAKCDDELWDAMAHRLKALEAKLATPIKIVNYDEFFICHVSGASDDYCKGWVDGRNAAARDVGKAGFTVEDKQ